MIVHVIQAHQQQRNRLCNNWWLANNNCIVLNTQWWFTRNFANWFKNLLLICLRTCARFKHLAGVPPKSCPNVCKNYGDFLVENYQVYAPSGSQKNQEIAYTPIGGSPLSMYQFTHTLEVHLKSRSILSHWLIVANPE